MGREGASAATASNRRAAGERSGPKPSEFDIARDEAIMAHPPARAAARRARRRRDAPPRPPRATRARPRAARAALAPRGRARVYEMAVLSSLAYVDWPAFASPRASPAAAAPPGPGGADRHGPRARAPRARPSAPLVVDFSAAVQAFVRAPPPARLPSARAARGALRAPLRARRGRAGASRSSGASSASAARATRGESAPAKRGAQSAFTCAPRRRAAPGFRRWALPWWLHDWWEPGAAGMRWHDTRVLLAEEQPCEGV